MAGHSKWANIKHRKARQDAVKGKVFTKIIREIVSAAKQGDPDPDKNPRLRAVIEKALSVNMTRDTINRAVARGTGGDDNDNMDEVRLQNSVQPQPQRSPARPPELLRSLPPAERSAIRIASHPRHSSDSTDGGEGLRDGAGSAGISGDAQGHCKPVQRCELFDHQTNVNWKHVWAVDGFNDCCTANRSDGLLHQASTTSGRGNLQWFAMQSVKQVDLE